MALSEMWVCVTACLVACVQVRVPTHIVSSICDDRGEEPKYAGTVAYGVQYGGHCRSALGAYLSLCTRALMYTLMITVVCTGVTMSELIEEDYGIGDVVSWQHLGHSYSADLCRLSVTRVVILQERNKGPMLAEFQRCRGHRTVASLCHELSSSSLRTGSGLKVASSDSPAVINIHSCCDYQAQCICAFAAGTASHCRQQAYRSMAQLSPALVQQALVTGTTCHTAPLACLCAADLAALV
eukprot:1143307-Pelagomonas_calceolata.AAC.7